MATVGYSGPPLIKKLGIKPDTKLLLRNAPGNYFDLLEIKIPDQLCKKNKSPDLVHLFVRRQ